MKKIILILTILFIITGCQNQSVNKDNNQINETNSDEITNIEETKEDNIYIDDNPIKIALYENNNIVKSYNTTLSNFKDIAVFDIYYTDIEKVSESNTKDNYLKYYNEYQSIENYKTGFYFTFEADGKKIEHLALDPNSQHAMTPYLYIYLYDDVNQEPYTYYSHLEPKDIKDNTIYSSIKLFLAQEGSKITSPITMTVFTYDNEDDFDEFNKYRGNSSYTITIDIN